MCIERPFNPETRLFKVTEEHRCKLKSTIQRFSAVLDPTFRLPSRHALTRYITSFFGGFHLHMPFIHVPTWTILERSAETILGIAAIGAQYCFETKVSQNLFWAGKAVVMERLSWGPEKLAGSTRCRITMALPRMQPDTSSMLEEDMPLIESVRALITLMGFATWEPQASFVKEAFILQDVLAHVLKDVALSEEQCTALHMPIADGLDEGFIADREWRQWAASESDRRSKLIAFSFLHTHSIAYDVYPVIRSNEIHLRLPCPTEEWKASNAMLWRASRSEAHKPQLFFQEALSLLLRNSNDHPPLEPIPTPLGNYILLHALIQRIYIVRDLSLPVMSKTAALPAEELMKLEYDLSTVPVSFQ